jgi:hypothetical protein
MSNKPSRMKCIREYPLPAADSLRLSQGLQSGGPDGALSGVSRSGRTLL